MQNLITEIAAKRQKKVFEWSYSTGIVPAGASIQSQKHRNAATKDPLQALDQVIEQVEPAEWNQLRGTRAFVDHRWLRFTEAAMVEHHPRYVLLRRDGLLVAAAVCAVDRRFADPAPSSHYACSRATRVWNW